MIVYKLSNMIVILSRTIKILTVILFAKNVRLLLLYIHKIRLVYISCKIFLIN
jgi:hypothetical protein